ncbi:SnoaL-like domain-containing protein [Gordonia sp. TBRC 11910]|uniref:SnoaL-like domain-containing protein n=1 Tax=Gordonia asplenii TaxID=2725283 RepID=A0A848KPS6_9ACTN|nr:limonene-1,2-epoxide hydrolase family protein [Gordonia asplenii]NMO00676.1 SnoaL-like domain-containing protein [Gordonia asplenii]
MTSTTALDLITDRFLDRLAGLDIDGALESVDDAIVYSNVGLPTVRGKKRFASVMRLLNTKWSNFDYRMLNAAADGDVVLTERIDELTIGPLRLQFWVCGRFEISDGRIVVWRDYFDFFDCTKALVRGVVALAFPRVLPPLKG